MPTAAPKHCYKRLGAAHVAPRTQQQRKYDARRGSSSQRGYGYKWQQYSRAYRAKHPLCHLKLTDCTGLSEAVDHIVPVNGAADPLFWRADNHQAVCKSCHSVKTAREDGGFGRVSERGGGPIAGGGLA